MNFKLKFDFELKPWLVFLKNMNNSKRVKCYIKNGGSLKWCLLNGVHMACGSGTGRISSN